MIRRPREMSVVSGPPLSVGRLRQNSARNPRMHWRGVGLTACIGTFDLGEGAAGGGASDRRAGARFAVPRLLREMPSEDEARPSAAVGGPPRSTRAARSRRTLAGFFESGGREIVVLDAPRSAAAGQWIGDDGGPGKRTGVFQLLDLQDVSTILVLVGDGAARERVLGVARRRPDKLFLCPALSPRVRAGGESDATRDSDGSRQELKTECVSFLLPNSAEVCPFPDEPTRDDHGDRDATPFARRVDRLREVDGLRDLGRLLAMLDATEFSERPRFRRRPVAAHWPERSPGVLRLMAWRRWEGLRRSIELGSRWTVMELHHPLVWRHVERDVRGFLHRMAEYGLVRGAGSGGFQVRCGPRPASASASQGSAVPVVPAVDIQVSVRLTPPYDAALNPVAFSESDLDLAGGGRPQVTEVEEKDPSSSGGEEQP